MLIVQIIYNLSVLVAASVISNFIDIRWNRSTLTGKILQGITFGFISILAMLNPFVLAKGIIFDGRSVVLSICALFFGFIPGIISGIMALVTRIFIGGSGMWMGISVISSSVLIGLFFYNLKQQNKFILNNISLYVFGLIIHIVMILLVILLPHNYTLKAVNTIGITVIIFYPIATVLIGRILLDHEINLKTIQALKESEERFRLLFENSADGIMLTSPDGKIYAANKAACEMLQLSEEEICLYGREKIVDLSDPNLKRLLEERKLYGKAKGELCMIKKDGTKFLVEISSNVFVDKNGQLKTSIIIHDISEKKKAEEQIKKLNRVYALLSNVNQMLIKTKDIDKIYEYTCEIAVQIGKFKMAWIGVVDEINQKVKPMVFTADYNYLYELNIDLKDKIRTAGPTGMSVITKTFRVSEDIELNEEMKPWKEIAEQYGFKSTASFPIIVDNKVIATLNLYSGEKYFFDEIEIKLFNELAKDIAFTIKSIQNEKKKEEAEKQIIEKERFLSTIIDNLPGFIYRCANDRDWTMFYITRQCEEITEYKPEDFINNNLIAFNDIIHPDYRELLWNEWQRILKDKKIFQYEYPIITKSGKIKWVWERGRGIFNEKDELLYLEGFITEITERKELEISLKENEEKLRLLVEGTPYFFFYSHDVNGYINYISPSVEQITGHKVEEWLNQNHWFLTDSPINEIARKNTRKLLHGEKVNYPVYIEIYNSKKEKILLETYEIKHIKDGEIIGIHGIARDVTKQKTTEELLKKSYERLNRAEIVSNSGNWELNLDTKKITASRGAALIYGLNIEEVDYEDIKSIPLPEYRNLLDSALKNLIENNIPYDVEFKIKKVDTGEIRDIHSVAFYDKNSRTIFGIIQDITDKKKILEELIRAKERAEISEKIKSNFLAQMSHEIRTPINIIMGNLYLIKEEVCKNNDSEICELFNGIELANKRIMRTIDLILNMSELQTKTYEPIFKKIDLEDDILKNLYDEYKLMAENKKLQFNLLCNVRNPIVIADVYSTTQIFANLIDNAIKYTKEGKVEIIVDKNEKDEIYVEVRDTGIGMSEEYMQHIFEPFNQEEQGYTRSYDGTGLGLALVKNYCDINNASISVESKKNVGTTFRVTFSKNN